ncbi:copper homeostasis protein CutC [Sphingomonas sp. Leaf343]|uniref:copper homeostasis protein CutC n=1 Tax=Sphingomonas sp. Leaf343 TaxID=1736345 RepID=UPI0006FF28AF|nr:copper homeostasis protein CutC [Sphingomonas sp. Leaf343]KQR80492.1 hypothetical protein ASG07_15225 [Sphingomonas sp. Leaf343]
MTGIRSRNGTPATLEICVDSPAGIAAAIAGGADRIELCSALDVGGLTPGGALAEIAVARAADAGIAVHAMVRSRSGDFAYDADEIDLAIREAIMLVDRGVQGLVFGAVRHGRIDEDATARWVKGVRTGVDRPVALVFHRAIDLVDDPVGAVDRVAALGFSHILTSGGAPTAGQAHDVIAAMIARAAAPVAAAPVAAAGLAAAGLAKGRVEVIAGSGVRPDNVAALVAATGVAAVHASASRSLAESDARVVAMGFASAPRRVTDADVVTRLKMALDNKSNVRQ